MHTAPDKPQLPDFETRINELLRRSSGIAPTEVVALLKRAEMRPDLDIEQELNRLRNR